MDMRFGTWKVESLYRADSYRRRWESNSRMDLREIGWEGVNWMHLDLDMD
jgi:hypothetical protein